jgi:haloalkane dehalogenase
VYRKIIVGLRDDFRCIAPDYPGFGLSAAAPGYGFTPREHSQVLERFVDRLGLCGFLATILLLGGYG